MPIKSPRRWSRCRQMQRDLRWLRNGWRRRINGKCTRRSKRRKGWRASGIKLKRTEKWGSSIKVRLWQDKKNNDCLTHIQFYCLSNFACCNHQWKINFLWWTTCLWWTTSWLWSLSATCYGNGICICWCSATMPTKWNWICLYWCWSALIMPRMLYSCQTGTLSRWDRLRWRM